MSHRKEQVASTLQRAIQQVLVKGLNDPRVRGLVTVTEVHVPADLRTATVMISVLPEERQNLSLRGIQDAARHIRHEIGELVDMKQIPELHFKLDLSLKKQAKAMAAINKAIADRELHPDRAPDDDAPHDPGVGEQQP
jgi:ribosome-binding factor A